MHKHYRLHILTMGRFELITSLFYFCLWFVLLLFCCCCCFFVLFVLLLLFFCSFSHYLPLLSNRLAWRYCLEICWWVCWFIYSSVRTSACLPVCSLIDRLFGRSNVGLVDCLVSVLTWFVKNWVTAYLLSCIKWFTFSVEISINSKFRVLH